MPTRSLEIRKTCVGILKRMNKIVEDPSVERGTPQYLQLYSEIERLSGELIRLGIRSGMSAGHSQSEYFADPVLASEYLAGQLLEMTGRTVPSVEDVTPMIEEHNEMENKNGTGLVNLSTAPKKILNFVVERNILCFLIDNFDAADETSIETD